MKPTRNPRYLAWIRTLPCLVCGKTAEIEAAHTGPHGTAQKSPDNSAVPLCARHPRTGRDSYHKLGPKAFQRHHRIDFRLVVEQLNAKPSVRIEIGVFVARYRDQEYILGPVEIGIRSAIRQALAIERQDREWCLLKEAREPAIQDFIRIRERLQEGRS